MSDAVSALSYAVVNGTTIKYNGVKDVSQKLKLGNNDINYEIGYKPSEHNNENRALALKHTSNYSPASGKLDNTESLKVGVPSVGPIRPWFTVSVIKLSFPSPSEAKYYYKRISHHISNTSILA